MPGRLEQNPGLRLEASTYAHRPICLACYIVFKLLTAYYFPDSFLKFKLDSFLVFYNTLLMFQQQAGEPYFPFSEADFRQHSGPSRPVVTNALPALGPGFLNLTS